MSWLPKPPPLDSLVAPEGRHCDLLKNPKKGQSLTKYADSAKLAETVGRLSTGAEGKHVLTSIAFDKSGAVARLSSIESDAPLAVTDSVAAAVQASLQPQKTSDQTWGFRIRITLGTPPSEALERAMFCEPKFKGAKGTNLGLNLSSYDVARLAPEWRHRFPTINVVVDVNGYAKLVRLPSHSGVQQLDDLVTNWAESTYYWPALLDGFPIEQEYDLDMMHEMRFH
jgi:hypothetical protein